MRHKSGLFAAMLGGVVVLHNRGADRTLPSTGSGIFHGSMKEDWSGGSAARRAKLKRKHKAAAKHRRCG